MDSNRLLLTNMLSAAIRNEKIGILPDDRYEWNKIYEEAKEHGIHALLYPVFRYMNIQKVMGTDLMLKWQKAALSQSMYQLQLMKEVQKVLMHLHTDGIKVIALKGIVLRELYPYPELRSMGDADILVHRQDVDRAREILNMLGFREGNVNPEHMEFKNENNNEIELHWTLIGNGRFKKAVKLEETVWLNAVETTIFETPVLMLGKEDNFLYTGLHMAKHIISSGFGLRQLSDFVLLYEAIKAETDWNTFFDKLDAYGVKRFFILLMLACERLFAIELPDCRCLRHQANKRYSELLIEEIFDGGLFGYRSQSRTLGSFELRKVKSCEAGRTASRYKYIKQLLNPPAEQLGSRYGYALKYRFLLPVAWIHRIIVNAMRKEFSFGEKVAFSRQYGKRAELMGWLGLR